MKKQPGILLWFLIITGSALLMSCNMPIHQGQVQGDQEINLKYATVSALLTETASVESPPVPEPNAVSTNTQAVQLTDPTVTVSPDTNITVSTPTMTARPKNSITTKVCDLAQAGKPIDITIPDDTRLHPGQYFSKTWRLVNAGHCSWTRDYSVVWFSGDQLGLSPAWLFTTDVIPGNYLDVTVEMIAPLDPGTYQSNWKLKNQQGNLFGIGPQGDAPFWVKIVVIPLDTPTATPTLPLATSTPVVFTSGSLTISLDQEVDLDKGLIDSGEKGDLLWKKVADGSQGLTPKNGARFVIFGANIPEVQDCNQAQLSEADIPLGQLQTDTYLCYRTSDGLPGRLSVSLANLDNQQLTINFLTWLVP